MRRGRTLEDIVRGGTRLPPSAVVRVGLALGRALAEADAGRPVALALQHVALDDDGHVADVGAGAESLASRADAPVLDDALFAAPETLRSGRPAENSRVYSVGVVLYRLLTGAFPVSGEAARQGRHEEVWSARADLRGSAVPLPLAQIVERAIDPRPAARQATLDTLCTNLAEAARELQASAGPTHRTLRYAAALLVALIVAAVVWVVRSPINRSIVAVRFQYDGTSIEGRELVDGLTIETSRRLAQLDGSVMGVTLPPFSHAYTAADAAALGAERRASFVIGGLVDGEPGAWRTVEASVVRVHDAKTVWAQSLPIEKGDILAAQERIVAAAAREVQRSPTDGRQRYSTSGSLQELLLRARALQTAGTVAGRKRAVSLLEQVVAADPAFVPAIAMLATTLGGIGSENRELPAFDARMAEAARRAYSRDPDLAEANAAMGLLSARLCQWKRGKELFAAALRRAPGVPTYSVDYALSILLPLHETAEALEVLNDALQADPTSLHVRRALGHVLVAHGDYDRAMAMSRALLDETPHLPDAHQTLRRALALSGRAAAAAEGLPDHEEQWGFRGYLMAVLGRRADARTLADAHPNEPARQMLVYAGLNDVDRTIDALERTGRQNPWRALTWMARPEIAPVIRGDVRAAAIRDRLYRAEGCGEPARSAARVDPSGAVSKRRYGPTANLASGASRVGRRFNRGADSGAWPRVVPRRP